MSALFREVQRIGGRAPILSIATNSLVTGAETGKDGEKGKAPSWLAEPGPFTMIHRHQT